MCVFFLLLYESNSWPYFSVNTICDIFYQSLFSFEEIQIKAISNGYINLIHRYTIHIFHLTKLMFVSVYYFNNALKTTTYKKKKKVHHIMVKLLNISCSFTQNRIGWSKNTVFYFLI